MQCFMCKETVMDIITCKSCSNTLCYSCSGVPEKYSRRWSAEQRSQWKCGTCTISQSTPPSVAPATIKTRAAAAQRTALGSNDEDKVTLTAIMSEIKAFRGEFSQMQNVTIPALSTSVTDMNKNITAIDAKLVAFDKRLTAVEHTVQKMDGLTEKLKACESQIQFLSDENDKINQYGRFNNVEVSGIPFKKGENLYSIMRDLFIKVGLSSSENIIDSVHRVRRYPDPVNGKSKGAVTDASGSLDSADTRRDPSIIVRMARRRSKDELIAAVRSRRGMMTADIGIDGPPRPIYVNEHLTPRNKLLLRRARELKAENGYMYLWVRNCVIQMRKKDNAPAIKILCEEDLNKIM